MLFSLIYTWIKYKMLPPSLVALNRLVVERDSKHRRITSNLGLTFRNSKWAHYARTNINADSRYDFLRSSSWVLFILLGLILLLSISYFYNNVAIYNPFIIFYWFAMDGSLYLQLTFSTGFFYLLQALISNLYYKLISFILGKPRATSHATSRTSTSLKPLFIPKRLHKPALYLLLKSTSADQFVVSLFETNSKPKGPLGDLEFVKLLYRTVYLTRLTLEPTPFVSLVSAIESNSKLHTARNPQLAFTVAKLRSPVLNTLTLDYIMFSRSPKDVSFSNTIWTLKHISFIKSFNYLSQPQGLFYLPFVSQGRVNYLISLYPELASLRTAIEDQMHAIRWNRWLYNYSLLHRSSFKTNSHLNLFKSVLTMVPNPLTMGVRNLWMPISLTSKSSTPKSEALNTLYGSLYGAGFDSYLRTTFTAQTSFYTRSPILGFSFYETSYDWALGRFYNFYTTPVNELKIQPYPVFLRNSLNIPTRSSLTSQTTYRTELISTLRNSTHQSTLSCANSPLLTSIEKGSLSELSNEPYLIYEVNIFFSRERLNALYNLSVNPTHSLVRHNNQSLIDTRMLSKINNARKG